MSGYDKPIVEVVRGKKLIIRGPAGEPLPREDKKFVAKNENGPPPGGCVAEICHCGAGRRRQQEKDRSYCCQVSQELANRD